MALLAAYIDDSGTHQESSIAVAAGFVSDVGRWARFEEEWRVALQAGGILERGFHMAEFSQGEKGRGFYKGCTSEQLRELYDSLVAAINKHMLFGVSAAVRKEDYDALVTGKLRQKLGGHYRFAVAVCMWEIQQMLRQSDAWIPEPIDYIYARGTKGNDEVDKLFHELGKFEDVRNEYGIYVPARFEPAAALYPLQAADIAAWKSLRYLRSGGKRFLPEIKVSVVGRFFSLQQLGTFIPEVTEKYERTEWTGPPGGFV